MTLFLEHSPQKSFKSLTHETEFQFWSFFCCERRILKHEYKLYAVRQKRYTPITVAARSEVWTVFARLNAGIVDSNPTQGRDVCLHFFCVCTVLCAGRALRRADAPSKVSYWLCTGLRNWKSGQVQSGGCRAIDRWKGKVVPVLN
jgi:hypothetical protein